MKGRQLIPAPTNAPRSESSAGSGSSSGSGSFSLNMVPQTPMEQRMRDESLMFDDDHLSLGSNKQLKAYGSEFSHKLSIPDTTLHAFVEVH